jgi:hypothetical protein
LSHGAPKDGYPWRWHVSWAGKFSQGGNCSERQRAADQATEAWWHQVEKAANARDVEGEIKAMLDRIEQELPTRDLLKESTDYLHKVIWHIVNRWREDIKFGRQPENVAILMDALSEELFERRTRDRSTHNS